MSQHIPLGRSPSATHLHSLPPSVATSLSAIPSPLLGTGAGGEVVEEGEVWRDWACRAVRKGHFPAAPDAKRGREGCAIL